MRARLTAEHRGDARERAEIAARRGGRRRGGAGDDRLATPGDWREGSPSVVNILDPDVIVLGGGLSNIDALYETVPALMAAHVFSDDVDTPIVKNRHGDASGVRGAAWLWPQEPSEEPA